MRHAALSCLLIAWVIVVFSTGLPAQESGGGADSAANNGAEPLLSVKRGQFRALLVGVNDYERLNDLRFCEEDVRALRDQLVRMGFQRDAIKCLTTGDPDPALRPSFRNITERLDALFAGVDERSVLVIALAGHGGSFEFRGPSGEDAKASFYCPQDGRLYDPRGTMISVKSIYDRLERCPARFKMLLVDACRDRRIAPPGARTAIDEARTMAGFARSLSDGRLPKGTLALVSCTSGEQSYEDTAMKHGIFMYYLLQGLSGRADAVFRGNRDGVVSYHELKDYVYRKTSDHTWRKYDQPQTPDFRANWELPDFDLARASRCVPNVFTAWPFDASEARWRQEETAEAIGQPVESTNSIGMTFRLIPPGEFMMGSPDSAATVARLLEQYHGESHRDASTDRYEPEHPRHRVRITRPFYAGSHEVTVGQFRRFVSETGYRTDAEKSEKGGWGYTGTTEDNWKRAPIYSWRNTGFTQDDDHPVVNVSWNDAVAFCQWLSRKEGKTYGLLTEAQWEYACRAGSAGRFISGNDPAELVKVDNVYDAAGRSQFPEEAPTISTSDGFAFSAPVGRFRSNAFGLFDMQGNVCEWCADWFEKNYYDRSPALDPAGPMVASSRVRRGGSGYS